jgi:methylenetetrahydrofolate reductase (NADPH)
MKIASIFKPGKTVFSLEVFPPKRTSPINTIYETLEELKELTPDFISVTYGAGGNLADSTTCDIASIIKNQYKIEAVAHLTCVNSTRDQVKIVLEKLRANNIENILALRGDFSDEYPRQHDFAYARDLIAFLRQEEAGADMGISGACYPEGHPEAESEDLDLAHLKDKVEAGAEHLVTQLFFDNSLYYDFVKRARKIGITVPIEAGIMPVVNNNQIQRMVSLCGASLPGKFSKMMNRYENNPEAMRDAGIAYAVDQIVDLVSNGVEGVHLYTMNNPYIARKISESVKSLF